MRNKNGFTLIEVLLALSITLVILLNVSRLVSLAHIRYISYNEDIPTGAKQLSNYLMTGTIDHVGHSLSYQGADGKTYTVQCLRNRLVKRPGYETIIYDIDDADFSKKDHYVFMTIHRDHKKYCYLIGENYEKTQQDEEEEEEESDLPALESAGIES